MLIIIIVIFLYFYYCYNGHFFEQFPTSRHRRRHVSVCVLRNRIRYIIHLHFTRILLYRYTQHKPIVRIFFNDLFLRCTRLCLPPAVSGSILISVCYCADVPSKLKTYLQTYDYVLRCTYVLHITHYTSPMRIGSDMSLSLCDVCARSSHCASKTAN